MKGKIAVTPTKPLSNQRDLSLAYTPGVAVPCLRIHDDPDAAYRYTTKGNLVAVISNGTDAPVEDVDPVAAIGQRRPPRRHDGGLLRRRLHPLPLHGVEERLRTFDELATFDQVGSGFTIAKTAPARRIPNQLSANSKPVPRGMGSTSMRTWPY